MRRKSRTIKTKTSLYLLFICSLLTVIISLYFTLYKQISKTIYKKEEQNVEIFTNQIERTLTLIFNSVNRDLSKLVENEKIQEVFIDGTAHGEAYSYVRNEIMKTIAFNSYNSFVDIKLYNGDRCIYPEQGKQLQELLTKEEQEKVEEYNGNTVWLHRDDEHGWFVAAKKVLLSSDLFRNGGYVVALINTNIMNFIRNDFENYDEAKIVLSNEFGDIAVKEGEENGREIKNPVVFEKELSVPGFKLSFYLSKADLYKSVSDMQHIMFKSILVAAVIFLVLSYIMSVYILRPFKDIITVMEQSEGKLQVNNKKYTNYEANRFNIYYNRLVEKNQKLIHDNYEKDIQMLQTQLEMLQIQINPHFLYNTLESVYLTLEAKKEKESAKIVYLLSKLFKYALKANKTVALSNEVEMMKRYLEIEKYRFGNKFEWNVTIDRDVEDVKVPKLLLQPLVENVVKHGIEPARYKVELQVSITSYENILMIVVHDNGSGMSTDRLEEIRKQLNDSHFTRQTNLSIGLVNVYRRLTTYFGDDVDLDIESEEGKYTQVTIIIPGYGKLGIEKGESHEV